MSWRARALVCAAAAALLSGCVGSSGGSGAPTAESSPTGGTSSTAAGPNPSIAPEPPVARRVSKVLVVVLENHSAGQALEQMPRLADLSRRYGVASNWYAVAHPSLPNYLMIAGGSTFGVTDDDPPSAHPLHGPSVFGQLVRHHHQVRVYAEDMPQPCALENSGEYAVKHNAWPYFADPAERRACRRYDVPAGTPGEGNLHDAVVSGRLPAYSQLIPNLCHDGHDCPLSTADQWLAQWMDRIRSGPDFRHGRLAVVVTFDEDDHNADNHILTVVVAERLHHKVVTRRLTHADLAALPSRMVGLPALRDSRGSAHVLSSFGLR